MEGQAEKLEATAPKLYSSFAKYYDRLESQYRDYEEDSRWIDFFLRSHDAKNVVDVSCGTGNHVSRLTNVDLFTVALDSSRAMIAEASKKNNNRKVELGRADFLNLPLRKNSFDCALCMYWSLAGLSDNLVLRLFKEVNFILSNSGILIFDVENVDGIKENLIDAPFIDSFFQDGDVSVIRANYSRKTSPDVVDWHAYYLFEEGGVSRLVEDRTNLRFYSRGRLEELLSKSGFETLEVRSGPFKPFEKNSPSLYFVAQKKEDAVF